MNKQVVGLIFREKTDTLKLHSLICILTKQIKYLNQLAALTW